MKDLYTKTNQYLLIEGSPNYNEKLKISNVGWWWTLWIICRVIGNIILRIDNSFADSDTGICISVLEGVLGIILAIVTIIVIEDYRKAEILLYDMEKEKVEENNNI